MSSVFYDKFTSVSQRIDGLSGQPIDTAKKLQNEPLRNFSDILASLEPDAAKANKYQELPASQSPSGLTNLSNIEQERSRAILNAELVLKNEQTTSSVPISPNIQPADVKIATTAVKESTPQAIPKSLQLMPYVHNAKYVASAEDKILVDAQPLPTLPQLKPPATPKLFSVEQITQPISAKHGSSKEALKDMIAKASQTHGVDPALSLAVAQAESSLNPKAVSNDGFYSKGLFQLLDSTGTELARNASIAKHEYDPFDPALNTDLGVRYLRRLMDTFSKETQIGSQKTFAVSSQTDLEKLAVAAFNAGEGNVTAAQHRANKQGLDPTSFDDVSRFLPKITQNHVQRVFKYREESLIG